MRQTEYACQYGRQAQRSARIRSQSNRRLCGVFHPDSMRITQSGSLDRKPFPISIGMHTELFTHGPMCPVQGRAGVHKVRHSDFKIIIISLRPSWEVLPLSKIDRLRKRCTTGGFTASQL